jgi:hypothetical protein
MDTHTHTRHDTSASNIRGRRASPSAVHVLLVVWLYGVDRDETRRGRVGGRPVAASRRAGAAASVVHVHAACMRYLLTSHRASPVASAARMQMCIRPPRGGARSRLVVDTARTVFG